MVRSLRVRHHGLDRVHVGAMDGGAATKLTFVLGRLLGEDVALERVRALDRTAAAYAEALLGARLCLHFRHDAFTFYLLPSAVLSAGCGGEALAGLAAPASGLVSGCSVAASVATFVVASVATSVVTFFAASAGAFGAAFVATFVTTKAFFGASSITICRPSSLGHDSTTLCGSRSFRIRSNKRTPNSWCAISRPRKRSVILALSPSPRNRTRFRSLLL